MANHLPTPKKALILASLVEGASIRSISRLTGVSKTTILRLLVETGERAADMLDSQMVGIRSNLIQVDEIWTFVSKKQKQLQQGDRPEHGDQYVFVAMDAETKLVPLWRVGKRDGALARSFMRELSVRIVTRFQLSTDSFAPYFDAVDQAWGCDVDYAQVHKEYGETGESDKRYSPAKIIRVTLKPLIGHPQRKHISTSYIERQNLTIRMQMRRFTRLTNAFSKKLENLQAALALHFWHYNFMRIHQTLRITPAMAAGVTKHLWTWEEFLRGQNAQSYAA